MDSVDDIIDDQIEMPKQIDLRLSLSPSIEAGASLSKKIINNYKSHSLQSMNVLLSSGKIASSRHHKSQNTFNSSDHIDHSQQKPGSLLASKGKDSFSINLVTSEEELEDEQEANRQSRVESLDSCMVTVTKIGYDNHVEQINESIRKAEDKKEKTRSSGSRKNFEDSDDDCTPSNSYHNSSESNSSSGSYNSLHNVNTESASGKHHQAPATVKTQHRSTKEASYDSFRDEASAVFLEHKITMSTNSNLAASESVGNEQTNSRNSRLDESHDDYKVSSITRMQKSREKLSDSNSENDNNNNKDQLSLLKYELKEKDLDIVQLQKEINELHLETKMLKARMPLSSLTEEAFEEEDDERNDSNNRYFQECRVLRREKEIALEELQRAQDTISRLKIEKSSKSIDLYDPNNPDVLHKRIKQHEKQMQELEDENEKHINELSKIEKSLAEYKAENNQLRSMANEARIYKENEEGMILELAGLKNELEKCIQFNQQLTEENQRLVEENNHKKTVSEGISVAVQTQPTQQEFVNSGTNSYLEEQNELLSRKLQQQQALIQQLQQNHHQQQSRTASQTLPNPYEYDRYYQASNKPGPTSTSSQQQQQQQQQQQINHPYQNYTPKNHSSQQAPPTPQFDHDNPDSNAYLSSYQNPDKYRLGGEKNLSSHALNENHASQGPITFARDSRRGSTHSSTFSYRENNLPMGGGTEQQYSSRDFNIQRNDDFLINNFRPFNGSSSSSSSNSNSNGNGNQYRQGPIYAQGQPTMSAASNSSRAFPTQAATYHSSLSQRSSHPMHASPSQSMNYSGTANTGSAAFSSTSLQRQREIDTSNSPFITKLKLNEERPTLSTTSTGTSRTNLLSNSSRYANLLNVSSSYSRSNSIVNLNGNSSMYAKPPSAMGYEPNEYSNSSMSAKIRHEQEPFEQAYPSTRRDSNASSHSTSSQSHTNTIGNNNTNNKDEVYSSSETILNPDDSEQLSITMGDQHEEKGSPHKSLKINVMRDLKCAAKIKSAYSTKNSDAQSTYTERKNSFHNILQEPVNFNEDRPHESGLVRRQSIGNRSPAIELPISKIKRSQTFSSTTLPRNYVAGKVRQSVMNIEQGSWNSGKDEDDKDFNETSPTNSQYSFYTENKSSTHVNSYDQEDDNEYDFNNRSYYRSKSADRTAYDRKSNLSKSTYIEKDEISSKSSLTQNYDPLARKRPFVPLKPDDIRIGNYIKFSRPGGKISKGSVKYIGPLPDRHDMYFGLELDSEEGKHDGIYLDKRYFQTRPNKGVFVSFSKIVMAWG